MATTNIAIACQGGGSHAAYGAGVLPALLPQFDNADLARGAQAGPGEREALNLVGISGTSGGAITALLAWYGFLTGGASAAGQKLDAFWSANCAQWPGEELFNNAAVGLADWFDFDLKLSPYHVPLKQFEAIGTSTWPDIARALGGFNHWMRGDYFRLGDLIGPHVDFAVVAALGGFCSIPQEVKRWLAVDLETRMYAPASARREALNDDRHRIQRRIEAKLAMRHALELALDAGHVPADALLRVALAKWREPSYAYEAESLLDLAGAVLEVTSELPQLLIGAVQIDTGDFTAFSSERPPEEGGISLETVLASAALPWLFEAQQVRLFDPDRNEEKVYSYWDGLFSQNPPIKNFMSGMVDKAKKPDGIWVLQINPDEFPLGRDGDAFPGNAIWPTRDALSGNLSLNQEVAFVEAINRRIEDGTCGADADKHITLHRIVMDGAAVARSFGHKLGAASKFDRSKDLKAALVEHGRAQAERFLALRTDVEKVSGDLGAILQQLAAPAGGMGATPAVVLPAISADQGVRDARLVVDGITVHRETRADGAEEPLANVRWHLLGAHLNGTQVRIEGDTGLFAGGAEGGDWRLLDLNVTGIGGGQRIAAQR